MFLGTIQATIKGRKRPVKVWHDAPRDFILEWSGGRIHAVWIDGTFDEFIELTLRYAT